MGDRSSAIKKWGKKISKSKTWRVTIVLLSIVLLFILIPLPRPLFDDPYATTLRSKDGELLSVAIASDHQWRFPESDSIPQKFITSVRLFEDEYFFKHPGINPVSLFRAVKQNVHAGHIVSGGSTITMQTVRMALGNQSRTYFQKLTELLTALKLEILYSKKEIIRSYADHLPFGGNIVGLNAASWRYFGRAPEQLSWAEAATLAILPNDPSGIFPGKNQEALLRKRNHLLDKIHAHGYLSDDDLFLSKKETLPTGIKELPDLAYHLLHRSMAEGEGKNVHTTIDLQLQKNVNDHVIRYSQKMDANQIHNAAAIIIDIENGSTLAYVGNVNNPGNHGQHVDVITARRSPGSLLKPILYAAALDDGLILPNQLVPDIPIFYNGFAPKNFDKKYRGAVPADEALSSSLNVPFVHLLIDYGYEKFHQKLKQMGLKSLDQPAGHYGLSLILGGAETSLWELTGVYAGMSRALQHFPNRPYRSGYSKTDYQPNHYVVETQKEDSVLESDGYLRAPSIAFALHAMLQLRRPEEEAGWEMFGSSRPITWKTGTSYGFRDAWAIGMNGKYLVGIWIGNADGEGRPGLTGVVAASPLMFDLFGLLDGDRDLDQNFGSEVMICRQSGMIAGPDCPDKISMQLPDYMIEGKVCTYHQLVHLNPNSNKQVNSSCYDVAAMKSIPWFVLPPVESWYYQKYHPEYKKLPPFDPTCKNNGNEKMFALIYPQQSAKVRIPLEQDGQPGRAIFQAAHEDHNAIIYWHMDDQYLGATQGTHQMAVRANKGNHILTLVDGSGREIVRKIEILN